MIQDPNLNPKTQCNSNQLLVIESRHVPESCQLLNIESKVEKRSACLISMGYKIKLASDYCWFDFCNEGQLKGSTEASGCQGVK